MRYSAADHWRLLTEFLGFEFHDLAFSFTESDCANPALMCHLRGLKAERLWKRSYCEGVTEYRDFAIRLMRQKEFPAPLIQVMEHRYRDPHAMEQVRHAVERYAREVLGLTEDHLVCLIYSPFTEGGRYLDAYLAAEHPNCVHLTSEIRAVLAGDVPLMERTRITELKKLLEAWSGLEFPKLQRLYGVPITDNTVVSDSVANPIAIMFSRDPHQAPVRTRHHPDGSEFEEIESGR